MKWAFPDAHVVNFIADNIRPQDEEEVRLSHAISGPVAVLSSWANSSVCRAILGDDDVPVGISGLVDNTIWLLGTEGLTATRSHRLQLIHRGREWVDYCQDKVDAPIGNYVYAKNRMSIRWLKHLGFHVSQPEPYGPSAALFCPFWRSR